MGVTVESLKKPTSSGTYSTTDTSVTLSAAMENSTGYATWDPGGTHEELVYWGAKSGTQVTNLLRGLSTTALTATEVAGNKKIHDDGETFAVTNVHYIINDKPSKTSDETISNEWTFSKSPVCSEAADQSTELIRYGEAVKNTGAETIAGKKTFSTVPDTTGGDPSADNDLARKAYVDSQTSNVKAEGLRNDNFVIGETGVKGNAYSLELPNNTDGGTAVNFGRDATSQGVLQSQSFIAGSVPSSFSMTVSLLKQGSPTDNVYITIEADNSGDPSGTPVTNGTSADVAGSGLTSSFTDISFTWSTAPTLVAGTKYWFVLRRDGSNSDTDYYQVEMASNNAFRSGQAKKYTTSWTTNTGNEDDLVFAISGMDGVAVKASTASANDYRGQEMLLGLLYANATQGDTDKQIVTEGVLDGFSGLTAGSGYYVSSTAGELSTTEQRIRVGLATHDDELYILRRRTVIDSSAGSADAAKAVKTASNGKIATSLINTGVSDGDIPKMDSTGYPAADGSQITNIKAGTAIGYGSRTAADGSGTQTVSCGFRPSTLIINAESHGSGYSSWSKGHSDGTNNHCTYQGTFDDSSAYIKWSYTNTSKAIFVQTGAHGYVDWSATITFTSTGFTIAWTEGSANTSDINFTYTAIR